ncbi:MAG: hypothetical protein U1F36_15875 [Planctomycetota bacterium]
MKRTTREAAIVPLLPVHCVNAPPAKRKVVNGVDVMRVASAVIGPLHVATALHAVPFHASRWPMLVPTS